MTQETTATVTRASKETARFAIRDLSGVGARLVGDTRLFESELLWIRIELEPPIEVAAQVVRIDDQRKTADVSFRDVSVEALAQIEKSITQMIARVRDAQPTVLVIHPDVGVSSALERDLARIDVAARVIGGIASTGDLSHVLEDQRVKYIGVIISGQLDEALGPSLEYLETHQPDLRRVVLYGEQISKNQHPAVGRVHAVLRTPWRFKGLTRALDMSMENVLSTYDQLVALKLPDDD